MQNYDEFSIRIDPNFAIDKVETATNPRKKSSRKSCEDKPSNYNQLKNLDSYSTYSFLERQRQCAHNPEMDSIRSGESIIKNYIFDNTKYNPNTSKCISFWRSVKNIPNLRPCPCELNSPKPSLYTFADPTAKGLNIFNRKLTWYAVLQELQKKKMDQVAFAATFQSCRLCERDEPYAKFKRKMGQNYSDTELRDYEDITCLNCWTSYSKAAEAAKNENQDDMTKVIYMNTCVCADSKKCTCSKDRLNSCVTEVSDQDITEAAYVSKNFNRTGSESGEGDSMSVTGQNSAGKATSRPKEKERVSLHFHNFRKLLNLENPSDELSSVIMEEGELEQEEEICECQLCEVSVCNKEIEDDESLPVAGEESSFSSFTPTPAEMIHPKYKPGCCYNCGILGCKCNICAPPLAKPKDAPKEPKKVSCKPKTVRIENFEKFLDQCEHCGSDCKCWKNKVDHAKNYLEDLKQILKENITYDKACGTQDSEEEIASTKSENICIICGHRGCSCKTSHGRPSVYFQTIEFGSKSPQMTTFAKVSREKIRMEESKSRSSHEVRRQPSDNRVNMEKLKSMRLKHQPEVPIIKDCKNKYMVTPAQKAKSIIKNNINLVIKEDLYGIPHVTRYPDKRPIVEPHEDAESYGSRSESTDETEIVHNLEPWYCTERPKEEEPEITYGRKL